MSGPYLESGESIVLTTDRVSIDNVVYEAMLTTRQMILIDNLHARFEPISIPLAAILSVRSGNSTMGEPAVIISLHRKGDEADGTRSIIFLQEPLENRKHDRDLWVKKLIEYSVSSRVVQMTPEKVPAHEGIGMRPSVRRWTAPEIARPRMDNFPVQEKSRDVVITLDETESDALPEILRTIPVPDVYFEKPGSDAEPEGSGNAEEAVAEEGTGYSGGMPAAPEEPMATEPDLHDSPDVEQAAVSEEPEPPLLTPTQVTIPDTSGSLTASIQAAVQSLTGQQEHAGSMTPGAESMKEEQDEPTDAEPDLCDIGEMKQGTEPAAPGEPELPLLPPTHAAITETSGSLAASILAAMQSLTKRREQTEPPTQGSDIHEREVDEQPDIPVQRTSRLSESMHGSIVVEPNGKPAMFPPQDLAGIQERLTVFDEIGHRVRTSSQIPEVRPGQPLEGEPMATPIRGIPSVSEPESPPEISEQPVDMMVQEPVGKGEDPRPVGGEVVPEVPEQRENPPASLHASPESTSPYLIVGGAILVILLVIAAILFIPGFQQQDSRQGAVVPATTPAKITQTTTAITPVFTPAQTPAGVPTILPATIPENGVWVRVVSNSYFTGQAGNPGYLKPVSGPGEKFVSMFDNNRLVQVSVEKQDYTRDELLVEVYANGTLVASRSTTIPMGTVDLLIDPATGNPPGITTPAPQNANATKTGTLEYF